MVDFELVCYTHTKAGNINGAGLIFEQVDMTKKFDKIKKEKSRQLFWYDYR